MQNSQLSEKISDSWPFIVRTVKVRYFYFGLTIQVYKKELFCAFLCMKLYEHPNKYFRAFKSGKRVRFSNRTLRFVFRINLKLIIISRLQKTTN